MPKFIYERKIFSNETIAYFAGIVDGEGSLVLCKSFHTKTQKHHFHATMQVCNCDKRLIDWIQNTFGGHSRAYLPSQTPKNSRKEVFRWTCDGPRLTYLCELILPYSVIKKEQIEIMLQMRNSMEKPISHKGKQGVQNLPINEIEFRQTLFDKMQTLHCRRGPKKKEQTVASGCHGLSCL